MFHNENCNIVLPDWVSYSCLENETMLINELNGKYVKFNFAGSEIYNLIIQNKTLKSSEILRQLRKRNSQVDYSDTYDKIISSFLETLLQLQLVIIRDDKA